MLVLEIGGWFIFSCILASFVEHQVHRDLMHRRNFLSAHTAAFKRVFEAHTLLHHKHYAAIFSDEPVAHGEDREIRLTVRKAPIKAPPFAALIAPVSWLGAAVFVAVMIFHRRASNRIHLECTSLSGGSLAPGRSISFSPDITASIAGTWTETSMLYSRLLTIFSEPAFGPTMLIENICSNGDCESTETLALRHRDPDVVAPTAGPEGLGTGGGD